MAAQAYTHADTGLQSFLDASPAYALAPIGLGSLQKEAQKLAEYGRNGDIYVVHAAEGETVVPMEVLDANPKVKALLFNQMRDMGLDPRRYVVGDELNSLNPVTGAPEFFFDKIFDAFGAAGDFLGNIPGDVYGAVKGIGSDIYGTFKGIGTDVIGAATGAWDNVFKPQPDDVLIFNPDATGPWAGPWDYPTDRQFPSSKASKAGQKATRGKGELTKEELRELIKGSSREALRRGEAQAAGRGAQKALLEEAAQQDRTQQRRTQETKDDDKEDKFNWPKALGIGALGIGAIKALGGFDVDDPEGLTLAQYEERLKAQNPFWYTDRKPGESDAEYQASLKRHRAPFLLDDRSLSPTLFAKEGGHVETPKYQEGGVVQEPDITRYLRSLDARGIPRATGWLGAPKPTDLSGITGNVAWHHMPDPAVEDPATNPYPLGVFYRPTNPYMPGGAFTRTRPFETYVSGVSTPYEVYRGTLGNITSEDRSEGTPWGTRGETYGEYQSPMAQARRGAMIWPVGQYQEYVIRSSAPRGIADEMFQATEPSWRNIGPQELQTPGGVFNLSGPMRLPPIGPGMGVASQMQMIKPIGKALNLTSTGAKGFPLAVAQATGKFDDLIDTDVLTRGIATVPSYPTPAFAPTVAEAQPAPVVTTPVASTESPYAFDAASLNPYAFSNDPSGNLNTGIGAALIPDPDFYRDPAPERTPVTAADTAFSGQALDPYLFAKGGGLAQFPERDLLVEGPGTERSDDIPAMLSDGEFVINARAVRGADPTGKGARYRGAQNLYNMMRNFEMRA